MAANATRVAIVIDGAVDQEHGWVGGDTSSLADSLGALKTASAPVSVVTRVTRSNQRSLEDVGAMVRGADAWVLSIPTVEGERWDALSPRLAMAAPWMLRAATRWGPRAFLHGVPLCLVGPYANRVLRESGRAFGPSCGGCAARSDCPGVGPRYLERFAGDEFRPRESDSIGLPANDLLPPELRVL